MVSFPSACCLWHAGSKAMQDLSTLEIFSGIILTPFYCKSSELGFDKGRMGGYCAVFPSWPGPIQHTHTSYKTKTHVYFSECHRMGWWACRRRKGELFILLMIWVNPKEPARLKWLGDDEATFQAETTVCVKAFWNEEVNIFAIWAVNQNRRNIEWITRTKAIKGPWDHIMEIFVYFL